jgi:hypothetical protein
MRMISTFLSWAEEGSLGRSRALEEAGVPLRDVNGQIAIDDTAHICIVEPSTVATPYVYVVKQMTERRMLVGVLVDEVGEPWVERTSGNELEDYAYILYQS